MADETYIQRATIGALELIGMLRGRYLKCDQCDETLGVEAVPSMKHEHKPTDARKLREYARELGWAGPLDYEFALPVAERGKDRCPKCSQMARSETETRGFRGFTAPANHETKKAGAADLIRAARADEVSRWKPAG